MLRGEILYIKMMPGDMLLSVVLLSTSGKMLVVSIDDTVRNIAYILGKDVRYTSDGEKYDD